MNIRKKSLPSDIKTRLGSNTYISPSKNNIKQRSRIQFSASNLYSDPKPSKTYFPPISMKEHETNYINSHSLKGNLCNQSLNQKKLRKINRLLNKMNYISFLANSDKSYITSHDMHDSQKSEYENKPIINNLRRKKKAWKISVERYNEKTLEKLANNDSSYFRDRSLNERQKFLLDSMKSTFLCSNYCRFQPLLNVFK